MAEARFKLLGEALEILGDEMSRKLFNEGYDKAAIDPNHDPNPNPNPNPNP